MKCFPVRIKSIAAYNRSISAKSGSVEIRGNFLGTDTDREGYIRGTPRETLQFWDSALRGIRHHLESSEPSKSATIWNCLHLQSHIQKVSV